MRQVTRCLTVTFVGSLFSASALANPEPPFLSDGRSNAMGGVGVATNDYASAPYHNPAGLTAIESFGLTATFMPVSAKLEGPFPNLTTGQTEQYESEPIFAPLGALSAGYRVHEKVVVGLAAFVPSAFGADYKGAALGRDASAHAFAAELQLPVAVSLTDDLSVGAAYRVTFSRLSLEVPELLPTFAIADSEATMTGWNFTGFSLGARYRLSDAVRVGVAYRSKVVVDVDGEREYPNGEAATQDASSEFPLPHTIKVGTEFQLLDKKLTLAVDGAYWVYSDSHGESPENMRTRAWDDSMGGSLGAEYWLSEQIPVRAGLTVYNSATNAGSAIPFGIPPGMVYALGAGSGIKLGSVDLDLALGYEVFAGETVSAADHPGGVLGAGEYSGRAFIGTLSANFRL
jgi:long-chain fatty acid transport protein